MQKGKMAVCLKTAVKRREAKSKGEKERHIHVNAEFQRIARSNVKYYYNIKFKHQRLLFKNIMEHKTIE